MELFKFYKVDDSAKSIFFPIDTWSDSGGIRYSTIIFGLSSPPSLSTFYDAGFKEASFAELDKVLRYRYNALVLFLFESGAI